MFCIGDRKVASLLWADLFGASALGSLDGEYRPFAFRAGFGNGGMPNRIVACRIGCTGVKGLTVAGLAFEQVALTAVGTWHSSVGGFFQWLDIAASRVSGAADEFAIASLFDH